MDWNAKLVIQAVELVQDQAPTNVLTVLMLHWLSKMDHVQKKKLVPEDCIKMELHAYHVQHIALIVHQIVCATAVSMDSNFNHWHMETFQQVIALKNVVMEKDSNFNVMMAIIKMEMDVLLIVELSKDGAVQEDQAHLPVSVCWEILTELICNWQEQSIYMEESFKVWDFLTFLKHWLLTDVLNVTICFGSEWSDQTLSLE